MKDTFTTIFGDFKPLNSAQEPDTTVDDSSLDSTDDIDTVDDTTIDGQDVDNTDSIDTTDTVDNDTKDNDFSFKPIWDELAEAGIISFDAEKTYEDSEAGFQEVIADSVAAKFKEELEAIPEEYRSIMDHLKSGGSLQEWVDKMDPTDYANAELEDEETQEIIIREAYKNQGLSTTLIEKKVTKLKEQGLLDTEAEVQQEYMVEKQKADRVAYQKELEQSTKDAQDRATKAEGQMKADINSFDALDDIPLTKELKDKLYQYAVVKDPKTGLTAYQKELGTKEGFFGSALKTMLGIGKDHQQRKAITKATSTMKKEFQKRTSTGTPSGKVVTTDVKTNKIPVAGMPWQNAG